MCGGQAKNGGGSATLSMAYAGAEFADSVMAALSGDKGEPRSRQLAGGLRKGDGAVGRRRDRVHLCRVQDHRRPLLLLPGPSAVSLPPVERGAVRRVSPAWVWLAGVWLIAVLSVRRLPSARTVWRPSTATVRSSTAPVVMCRRTSCHVLEARKTDWNGWVAGTVNDKEKKLIADMLPDLKAQVCFPCSFHSHAFAIVLVVHVS